MIDADVTLFSENDSRAFARRLATCLAAGDVIGLVGPLGAGKSVLARAMIETLTGVDDAPSPTFGLVHSYPAEGFDVFHFDLYRLKTAEEAWELGLEAALDGGVSLIEWPEIIADLLPAETLLVAINPNPTDGARQVRLRGGERWREALAALSETTDK